MVPTPITSLALSVYLCLLPLSVVGQFPQIGAQNALVVMNAMEVLEQKLIVLESKKELAIVTRAEHFRKALETFEDKQALIARGSLQFSDGTIIESNIGAGEQVIDPRTPVGLGDPLFRQIHVEQKIELASIMSPHQASELRAMIGPLQIEIVSGWKFLDGRGTLLQQNSNRHRTYFMSLVAVAPNKIIRRQCDSCKLSHQEIYYRRKDQSGVGGMHRKLLQMMLGDDYGFYSSDCGSGDTVCQIYNRCDIDFTLHSTYQDAIDNINPWQACRNVDFGTGVDMYTASNKIGFPGYSGINSPSDDQFNQGRTDNGQIDYGFFVEDTKWIPIFGAGDLNIMGEVEAENLLKAPAALRESPHNIIRRVCVDCTDDRYKDMYYRRIFPVPDDVNLWGIIDRDFRNQRGNIHGYDYDIHSTYSDAINAENGWYCGEDDESTGDYDPAPAPTSVLYEAEAENYLNEYTEGVRIMSEYVGYTGTGYVDIGPGDGSYAEWSNIDGGSGGPCTLKFRYAVGGSRANRPGDLTINGNDMDVVIYFTSTNSFETYTYEEHETICSEGDQTIRLTFNGPWGPHIDSIQVIFNPTPDATSLNGVRHLNDSEGPSTQCLRLCCHPDDETAVDDYMHGICHDQKCHYERGNNGSLYCSGRNQYSDCANSCETMDSSNSPQDQGSNSQGEYEESGEIGFPGRCRPHINDPVDTFEGQWIKVRDNAGGVQHYAFYIEGDAVPETGVWMTENDEMNAYLNPGSSANHDSEISCEGAAFSLDTGSSDTFDNSDMFPTNLKPYGSRGQLDPYVGWYDIHGCGKCSDWCGWFSSDNVFDGGMNPRYVSWTSGNDMFACISGSLLELDYTGAPSYIPPELYADDNHYISFLNFFPNIDRCLGAEENSPPVRQYEYLGCYWDQVDEGRSLPRLIGWVSHDECHATCRAQGYNNFGRQHIGECWCGGGGWNADPTYDMYADVRYDRHGLSATNDASSTIFSPPACGDCEGDDIGGWLMCTFKIIYETPRPREPVEGSSIKCDGDLINIALYVDHERRYYPSVAVAISNDPNYVDFTTVDCTSIPLGSDAVMKTVDEPIQCFTNAGTFQLPDGVNDNFPPDLIPYIYQMPGIPDPYAGYYDVQRCGKCNDFCFWAGPSQDGAGINPEWQAYTETDYFTCKLAKGYAGQYGMTERGYFGKSFGFQKCTGVGDSTPSYRKEEYVGCFYDQSSDRALPVRIGDNSGILTVEQCAEACRAKGYHYFGRQEIGYCHCGGETASDNSYAKFGHVAGEDFSVSRIDGLGDYREISKGIAGDWGVGDFTISMDITGKGGELLEQPVNCGTNSKRQRDYRGFKSTTVSGMQCQRWDSQIPHSHTRTPDNYPSGGLTENYCRNPDGEPSAWCYTTDPGSRWESCGVPNCEDVLIVGDDYGVIFVRTTENSHRLAQVGPTAIISSNGDIQLRVMNGRPSMVYWPNALPNPTGTATRHLTFSRSGNTLKVQIDNRSRTSRITRQMPENSVVTDAPLRFNANQWDTSIGRLNVVMDNIRVSPLSSVENSSCSNCDGSDIGEGKQCVFKILDQYDPTVERKKHECSHISSINVRRHCYVSCRDADLSYKNLLACQTLKVTGLQHLNNEIASWRDSPVCDTKSCIKTMHPLGSDITQDRGVH